MSKTVSQPTGVKYFTDSCATSNETVVTARKEKYGKSRFETAAFGATDRSEKDEGGFKGGGHVGLPLTPLPRMHEFKDECFF